MRVLWLCNVVLNDFCNEFGIRKKPFGGWMESLFHLLGKENDLELGFCFPICDIARMKNSIWNGYKYYSYHATIDLLPFNADMKEEFKQIIKDFSPDIVHIWGTEYNHSRAMMEACKDLTLEKRVLLRIQGLVSTFQYHYVLGVPSKYLGIKPDEKTLSIEDEIVDWNVRGVNEKELIQKSFHIMTRGDYDEFYVKQINPNIDAERADNILRESFYENCGKWKIENCRKHEIFVSQASYPLKGLHFLLKAMGILLKKYPDISLYVAGVDIMDRSKSFHRNGYARYLIDLIEENSLEGHVNYVGLLDEKAMVNRYLRAHVFVCPSTIENRANSICEAMMLGTPTIASYVGGNIGVLRHSIDGYMYPVDEFYMLAGYIDCIFSDDGIAIKISENASRQALLRHEKSEIVKQIKRIYRKIAKA